MTVAWSCEASTRLIRLAEPSGGWAERPGDAARAEPTSLAGLALADHRPGGEAARASAGRAAEWLASRQRPDGSLAPGDSIEGPGWPTPFALLLWSTLDLLPDHRTWAAEWLLAHRGQTLARRTSETAAFGHDPTIAGWSWVEGTHSWLEPTAMAVVALRRHGLGDHPRVVEGLRLIRDRALPSGGWNVGNTTVFGRELRPQPAPTGLALLALVGTAPPGDPAVSRAIAYLESALPGLRAPASLAWGLIGLRAWGRRPRDAGSWLAESFDSARSHREPARRIALLLLASEEETPILTT